MSTAPATSPRPPRRRRWLLAPTALLLLVLLTLLWAYIRGTTAETAPRNPDSVSQRPVSQVFRTADGQPTVRTAVLLAHPRERVWQVVTDFDRYDQILPYLRGVRAQREADGTALRGQARSVFGGYWDFTLTARESREGQAWRVWWDESGAGAATRNRGGWTLTEPAAGQTLLALELEAEVRGYPTWVLRNFFLYRLRQVLAAVEARLNEE